MISKDDFKKLRIAFDKLGYKKFAQELENEKHQILQDIDHLTRFLRLYSLEFDKKKALKFAEHFLSLSSEKNREDREILLLRVQSTVYFLDRDLEKCKWVLKKIEKKQPKISKSIVSEVRLNIAMTARAMGDYSLAYEMYFNNITFWSKDDSPLAIRALALTYTNLSVLFYFVNNKKKGIYYFEKVEELLPKIEKKDLHNRLLIQSIYHKFDNSIITPKKAIKLSNSIESSLVKDSITFKIYMIQYLYAFGDVDQVIKLSLSLIENKGKIADNVLAQAVNYYLKCLFKLKKENEFIKAFDKHYDLLSSSESLKSDFLGLFDKKIEILEKANNFQELVHLYKIYMEQQKIIFEKNSKLELDISEAKLNIREKELELSHMKDLSDTKDEINKLLTEKNKSLENFASMTAHDIKSPINSISMFIGILKDSLELKEDEKFMFDFISTSSKKLSSLIDDLLSFANSGTFSNTSNVNLELNTILHSVTDNLKTNIDESNAKIEVEKNLPKIKMNTSAITVLFQNLINNAIKFTPKDTSPIINVSSELTTDSIHLHFKDNGFGISDEDKLNIFKPFGRSLKSKEIEGSGLGLATCLKIVKSYNGSIAIESELEKGSTFTITLPKTMMVS